MTTKKKADETLAVQEEIVTSIKGFDKDLKCRGFQFEAGKTYEIEGPVVACESGFHAIEGNPLQVFQYYQPAKSVYREVKQFGAIARHSEDSKLASAKITIGVEIGLSELAVRAVNWVIGQVKGATGRYVEGEKALASANGDRSSSAANGDWSSSAANGYRSSSAANGDWSSSAANGYRSSSAANGNGAVAMSAGKDGKAKGADGNALFLVYRDDDWKIVHAWAGVVGQNGIKPDVFYALDENGQPQECA